MSALIARLYRVALLAFPSRFRRAWRDDMCLTFADRLRDARRVGGLAPVRLLLRESAALLIAGIAERVSPSHIPPTLALSPPMRIIHAQDIRYAFRLLGRSPGFTLLTVLVLAGGLGLSTFTFSFLHTAMIRPLPLEEGERIVRVDPEVGGRMTAPDMVDAATLKARMRTMSEIGGFGSREVVVGRGDDRRVVGATTIDPALLAVARVGAARGRGLQPNDAAEGAEPVIVLSHRTWKTVFGGDERLVGATVPLDGVNTRVIGVMPEGYGFPVASEAWMPLPARAWAETKAGVSSVRLAGRLAPGVSAEEAAAEATVLLQRTMIARDTTVRRESVRVTIESFPAAQIGEERALVFTVLNLLAALILVLALVNVTNLLLARANERVKETAVRLALGASTGRLVMQGMWETIILCVAGGVLGTAGAAWGLDAITGWTQANMPGNMAFWWVWQINTVTLLCAGAFVTVAIAALGSVLSLRTTRMNVREVMQDSSARSGSRREGRMSRALVAVQVTTVTVLMFFGVLGGIISSRVVALDPGFDPSRLLSGGIEPPVGRYPTPEARGKVFADVAARLTEQGALASSLQRRVLADQTDEAGRFTVRDTRLAAPSAHVLSVLGELGTIGVQTVEGRALAASDDRSRLPVAMVSRSLASRLWPGRSAVGQQLRLDGIGDSAQYRTIVGVTSDILQGDPMSRERTTDAIYIPLLQTDADYSVFLVRYRDNAMAARGALMSAFAAVDPLLVPDSVQPYAELLDKIGMIAISTTKLFASCFAFALLLALVGTYGLMSRAIGGRTREIGVRRALGATDAGVTRMLLVQGGRQLAIGTLIATPFLTAMGIAVRHWFPISGTLAATSAVAVSASIIALVLATTYIPTRRTLRIGLTDALRAE